MKVWPIDPLVPRNLRLEVPEKLPQGLILPVRCPCFRIAVSQLFKSSLVALQLALGMPAHGYGGLAIQR